MSEDREEMSEACEEALLSGVYPQLSSRELGQSRASSSSIQVPLSVPQSPASILPCFGPPSCQYATLVPAFLHPWASPVSRTTVSPSRTSMAGTQQTGAMLELELNSEEALLSEEPEDSELRDEVSEDSEDVSEAAEESAPGAEDSGADG